MIVEAVEGGEEGSGPCSERVSALSPLADLRYSVLSGSAKFLLPPKHHRRRRERLCKASLIYERPLEWTADTTGTRPKSQLPSLRRRSMARIIWGKTADTQLWPISTRGQRLRERTGLVEWGLRKG